MDNKNKKHTKIFMKHHGYGEQDNVPCAVCGCNAVDIHHIEPKGMGGRDMNDIDNLIALCRRCHEMAHTHVLTKHYLKSINNETN